MKMIDLSGKTALITGGTGGIGLASALNLGAAGAQTVLTFKWGSSKEGEVLEFFERCDAPKPMLFEADVSREEDTVSLMNSLKDLVNGIDIFVSNVGFALKAETLDDYRKKSLYKTFDYSSWPIIDYTKRIKEGFGRYPRYVVGISSNGPDHYYRGYDYVAASKALLEFFTRYLAVHLYQEDCRVNSVRFGMVKTASFSAIFGDEYFRWLKDSKGVDESDLLSTEDCGKVVLALCSGLLDAMNGQIIEADLGLPFVDNGMTDYINMRSREIRESDL